MQDNSDLTDHELRAVFLKRPGFAEIDRLDPGDLVPFLEVCACGICCTDRKAFAVPPRAMSLPRIPGHEVAGRMLLDMPGSGLKRGDRVVLWPALACGRCRLCKSGRQNLCSSILLFGCHLHGGLAEALFLPRELVPGARLIKIPENLSWHMASLCEPLACVLNGFRRLSDGFQRCLVVGAGLMGRLAARVAGLSGMEVLLHDIHPGRLEQALADGNRFNGLPADIVFVAASGEGAVEFGIRNLAPGGTAVLFSGQGRDCSLGVTHNDIHRREFSLQGAYGCREKDMRTAMSMLSRGDVKAGDLITGLISLEEVPGELCRTTGVDEYRTVMVNGE
ncbi:MAG TPA: hypothetical protein EYP57_05705 [Thermodesulfobacteriaceae bacterium]|nr:hypothetical protein [Thermodesulfobacteriaceae bacterium]